MEGDLPELAGEAHAWSVGREADLARIAALAEALGVSGQVRTTGLGWEVADGDRVLEVARQPGLPWSFSPSAAGALDQPVASQPVGSGDQVVCDMPECPPGTACVQVCTPEEPGPRLDPATCPPGTRPRSGR